MPEFPDEQGSVNEDFTREIASPKGVNGKTMVVTPHTATAVRENGEESKASVDAQSKAEKCTYGNPPGNAEASDDDEEEESWVLTKIMSIEELSGSTIKCSEKECMLAAACLYVSNEGEKWYGCLDCQVSRNLHQSPRVFPQTDNHQFNAQNYSRSRSRRKITMAVGQMILLRCPSLSCQMSTKLL